MAHLVNLPVCPIANNLDQLEDPCWILEKKDFISHLTNKASELQKQILETDLKTVSQLCFFFYF